MAHPGKTDHEDGHKCQRNCEEWDLYYSEYHLHDKDRNPIRIERVRKFPGKAAPVKKTDKTPVKKEESVKIPISEAVNQDLKKPDVVSSDIYKSGVSDNSCLISDYDVGLISAAGLLAIILIVMRIRKRRS